MAYSGLLFKSLFLLFTGFLIATATILNRALDLIGFLNNYFVLFMFTGIIISLIGSAIMVIWDVKNSKPFLEDREEAHYAPYLAYGVISLLSSFTLVFYYRKLSSFQFGVSLVLSVIGILLLLRGLQYFLEEMHPKKTASHY